MPRRPRVPGAPPEAVIHGLGVSPGIAIGTVLLHDQAGVRVQRFVVEDVGAEHARLKAAIAKSLRQIDKVRAKSASLPAAAADEIGFLLDAHAHMLGDSRLVRGALARIEAERLNAEAAVEDEIAAVSRTFAQMDDPYLAGRIVDIRDVGGRLIRNLTATPYLAFKQLPEGTIVVADEITPADAALMDPARVAGFASIQGGPEGHTAIMARSIGLPAVVGAAGVTQAARPGDAIIIDGTNGRVILRPTRASLAAHRRRQVEQRKAGRELRRLTRLPSVTTDGVAIALAANLETPRELDGVRAVGAEGIGLFRSEFMFMNRDDVPDADEQFAALAKVVRKMAGRPVTVRTLDVGGEKLASALGSEFAPGPNPALGLRAIRLSLRRPALLEAQFEAILRAGALGPVRILLPMIATAQEVQAAREVLLRCARRLVRKGVAIADPLPPVGAMIEVPGAALAADALARVCDFFAIGTNDLTMYTLAIDRGDEQVAHLYNPLHPAVLRLIQFTTEAALRNRIPVSLCGEIAGDPRYTGLLIGLGIRELSMSPPSLPRVKQQVRRLDLSVATRLTQAVMAQTDPARIGELVDQLAAAPPAA